MQNNHFTGFMCLIKKISILVLLWCSVSAWSQISDKPLLSISSNAKPNLMLLLDNSGSMDSRFVPDDYRTNFAAALSDLSAYQSPDANGLYYDPRIRYTPRQNSDGTFLPNATEASALTAMNIWANNNGSGPANGVFDSGFGAQPFNGTAKFTDALDFYLCTASTNAVCNAVTQYTVPAPANQANFIPGNYVPKSAARTDCTALPLATNRCNWAEERQNALNWLEYYSTRILATQTSVGAAFVDKPQTISTSLLSGVTTTTVNPTLTYANKFRLGYGRMNADDGTSPDPAGHIKRGVRPFADNPLLAAGFKTERTDFYTWLYAQTAQGRTPSKPLLDAAGQYFKDATNTGPWSAQPIIGDTSAHLACRRNNAVMFSDGEYNGQLDFGLNNTDNGNFGGVTNTAHVNPKTGLAFTYSTTPSKTATYIAYPDTVQNTMADLAMSYWIQDLRPDLTDTIAPISGNPAFWQHMTFSSIGYGIRGSVTPTDIAQYNTDFTNGVASNLAWGNPANGTNDVINDYIHAAYTGRGKFYSVKTANQVRAAFDDVISRTIQQEGSDAGVAVADTNNSLATLAGELKYVPTYSVLEGTGDIVAYTLDAKGNVVTPNIPAWYASRNIPTDFKLRNLVTMSGTSTGISLSTTFTALPSDVRTALGTGADDSFLQYLRGQTTGVNANTGANFRLRNTLMGTIVNSPPTYIRGELNMGYEPSTVIPNSATYAAFKTAKSNNSTGVLLAPSNDGMLHIVSPKTGVEVMGYIPRAAMPKLQAFSADPYAHKYILDGPIGEGDIYDNTANAWKSLAFGTGGRGGKYVYALSVPTSASTTGPIPVPAMTKDNLLWEVSNSDSQFSNLGNVLNPPQSGYLLNGKWVAIFGNGFYSNTGVASLFIVDAVTGQFIQEISTNTGSTSTPNGLGGVTLVRNKNRVVVAAIAGDKLGNMWKFDLRSTVAGGLKLAFSGNPLFKSIGNQPFTGAPAWRTLNGGMLVTAATGILIEAADQTDTSAQTIYGVLDKTPVGADETTAFTAPVDMTKLQTQTSSVVVSASNTVAAFYKISRNSVDYSTQTGWKLDLTFESGQRNIADVLNLNQTIVVTTVVPPTQNAAIESCSKTDSVSGYVYLLDAETGGNADVGRKSSGKGSGFDVNGDGTGDGVSVAKATGFPRGSILAQDQNKRIGPPTEPPPDDFPCDATTVASTLVGTGANSLGLVSTCGGGGFIRVWRQLLNPPLIK